MRCFIQPFTRKNYVVFKTGELLKFTFTDNYNNLKPVNFLIQIQI